MRKIANQSQRHSESPENTKGLKSLATTESAEIPENRESPESTILISVPTTSIDSHFVRDPFYDRPQHLKSVLMKQAKRTQRYRSTARSRICGMTVGDIRYCFQQLRNAGSSLTPHLVLYNGQCAGEFALSYLIETSNSMRKRRRKKKSEESSEIENFEGGNQNYRLPKSQLPGPSSKGEDQNERTKYRVEF